MTGNGYEATPAAANRNRRGGPRQRYATAFAAHLRRTLLCAFAALCLSAPHAAAADYPMRAVTIVVPYGAGGIPDVLARIIAAKMSDILGKPFIVVNRAGGAGIPGVMDAMASNHDGYTLLLADAGITAINPYIFSNLPYSILRDMTPISALANAVIYIAGRTSQFASFEEMISYAKANPGKLNYGSAGVGSIHHIAMEVLKSKLDLDLVHIPYKSSSQSAAALLAGDVQVVLASPPGLAQGLDTGALKMLAVLTAKRNPQYPDVPAVSEYVPNYEFLAETGLLAPSGTPPEIIDKLAAAAAQAVGSPDTLARFRSLGLLPIGSNSADYVKIIERNQEWFEKAVKIAGVKVD